MLDRSILRTIVGPILIIAATSCATGGVASAALFADGTDLDLKERFEKEAPAAWAVLDATEKRIEVVGTLSEPVAPRTDRHFRYACMGPRRLYESSQEKVSAGEVRCLSPGRSFTLTRKEPGGPWAIKSLSDSGAATTKSLTEYFDRRYGLHEPVATHGCFGIRLSKLVAEPEFSLKSVESLVRDGVHLARVSFDYAMALPGRSGKEVVDSEMILRPDKHWAVQEITSHLRDGTISKTRAEYGEDEGGLPTLRSFLLSTYFRGGDGVWGTFERRDNFSKYSYRPIPDAAFTLGTFGLPDELDRPVGSATAWGPGAWFSGLAAGFGLLAIALRVPRSRPSQLASNPVLVPVPAGQASLR